MSEEEQIQEKILDYLQTHPNRPLKPRRLARELNVARDEDYYAFRDALRELMHEGRAVWGASGAVVLPPQKQRNDRVIGTYRHNRRGFGFVVPTDPTGHEDLYIPEGQNGGAITGDVVSAKITSRGQRDGKAIYEGRIIEVIERTHTRFVGTLVRQADQWTVMPDGNVLTAVIDTPDAASRNVKPGTKVVVELTTYPERNKRAQGVITEVLGKAGEKDVDLRSVIIQFNLPGDFPAAVKDQARQALDRFGGETHWPGREDLTGETICTIDPDDAKDYDDAISLRKLASGLVELGVHIADVSYFVPQGSALDEEAYKRGNSCYFPGHVIPMLPEILSNGVCSLQEGVPRLCKSVFITLDEDAEPVATRFANTVIRSARRLRYREAQAIIDGAREVPHPEGNRSIDAYPPHVVGLLREMNALAKRIQKRRLAAGQIVLDLPEVELLLDEDGKVAGTRAEDQSFTHTLIEMFMVEANEAVARLLDSMNVPFMRRVHPEPEPDSGERMRHFIQVAGYKLPKLVDRKAIQSLLGTVRGRPEAFAINLAVLKSLARAEYSPEVVGHYALASRHYCHFTSPIRRYADLMVHRLIDSYCRQDASQAGGRKRRKVELENVISYDSLLEMGRHISFTERRADDAERELRQVKILELMKGHIGEQFVGVVTGITNFGIFIQIQQYMIDGLIRYEDLMDDWWDVDERSGLVRGQRTGQKIGIGDLTSVVIANVDIPRRELDLAMVQVLGRKAGAQEVQSKKTVAAGKAMRGRKRGSKTPNVSHKRKVRRSR